jgi:hypothetical protein
MKEKYIPTSFFDIWSRDADMKIFNKTIFRPTNEIKDESFYHNTWFGFPIENIELNNDADTSLIYKHFKHISNFDDLVEKYLLNWFASIIQHPEEKNKVMPILYGVEGSGKSILAEQLFKKMVGMNRMFITCKSKQLFGQFANLAEKLLVVFNEANAKDTYRYSEDIKDAITQDTTSVERKGVDVDDGHKSYTNFIATTNNVNSFKITSSCRRTIAIEVDDSIANNKSYFDELYRDLNDESIIRKFYEELKNRDITNFDCINDRPRTELTDDIKLASIDIATQMYMKMDERVDNLFNEKGIDGDVLYVEYQAFYHYYGGNSESCKKRQSFLQGIGRLSFCSKTRLLINGKREYRYVFDEDKYLLYLDKNEELVT